MRRLCLSLSLLVALSLGSATSPDALASGRGLVHSVSQVFRLCAELRRSHMPVTVKGFYVPVFTGAMGPTLQGALVDRPRYHAILLNHQRHGTHRVPGALLVANSFVRGYPHPPRYAWIVAIGSVACSSRIIWLHSYQRIR